MFNVIELPEKFNTPLYNKHEYKRYLFVTNSPYNLKIPDLFSYERHRLDMFPSNRCQYVFNIILIAKSPEEAIYRLVYNIDNFTTNHTIIQHILNKDADLIGTVNIYKNLRHMIFQNINDMIARNNEYFKYPPVAIQYNLISLDTLEENLSHYEIISILTNIKKELQRSCLTYA